jgi:hypothetical protein
MSEAALKTTPGGTRPPLTLEVIDLDAPHPDGELPRLCVCLGRMRSATVQLEAAIERTAALTIDGHRMKR